MRTVRFRYTLFYWALLALLVYTIGWHMVKFTFSGDPSKAISVCIEIFLFACILTRHEYTIIACYTWASYFILKGGIMMVLLCLEHAHNDFVMMESGALLSQIMKVAFGIGIAICTRWGVEYET